MTPEIAKNAMAFLLRPSAQGGMKIDTAEAPAFLEVMNALQKIANPEPADPAKVGKKATA